MKKKPPFDHEILDRAETAIPNGTSSYVKWPINFIKGLYPTHLVKGVGCKVTDTHGNEYYDLVADTGSLLLGYGQEEIVRAVSDEAKKGISFSLCADLEVKAAEKVKECFPFLERVIFVPMGHGHLLHSRIQLAGYGKWEPFTVQNYTGTDIGVARLKKEVKRVKEKGRLVMFNESVTAFRFPTFSASRFYDIEPDVVCFGICLGAGFPLFCYGGRKELLELIVSDIEGPDNLALSACIKQIELLQTKFRLEALWDKGRVFMSRFNDIWPDGVRLEGSPTVSDWVGREEIIRLFMQECCRSGVLVGRYFTFSFPHIEVMEDILSIFSDILQRIRFGEVKPWDGGINA